MMQKKSTATTRKHWNVAWKTVMMALLCTSALLAPCRADESDLMVLKNSADETVARLTEEGFLMLAGNFTPNTGPITLDPARKYWAVKNDEGAVLMAVDLESGDAFTSGPLHAYTSPPTGPTEGVLFTVEGEEYGTVFSVSSDGTIFFLGDALPALLSTNSAPTPMPTTQPAPTSLVWDKVVKANFSPDAPLSIDDLTTGWCNIPQPHMQGRLYYIPTTATYNNHDSSEFDITDTHIRLRYDSGKTTFPQYGLHWGMRFWNPAIEGLAYRTASNGPPVEYDVLVKANPDYDGEPGEEKYRVDWDGGHEDSFHSAVTNYTSLTLPGTYDIYTTVTDSGNIMSGPNANGDYAPRDNNDGFPHNSDDPTSSGFARVSLYKVQFVHPVRIPREEGTTAFLGCYITPLSTPDFASLTLKIWDPAQPTYFLEWSLASPILGIPDWDGYLYLNGNTSTTPTSVVASDIFMEASVHWNLPDPAQQTWWQKAQNNPEVFESKSVAILFPNKAGYDNHRFVFDDNNPYSTTNPYPGEGACTITVTGTCGISELDSGLQWSLEGITSSTLTATPADMKGPQVTFTYRGLPPNITDFGFKELTLSHDTLPGSTSIDVEIYFEKNAKNWPGITPTLPWYDSGQTIPSLEFSKDNSYYYYSQVEGAGLDMPWHHAGSRTIIHKSLEYGEYTPFVPFIGPVEDKKYIPIYKDPRPQDGSGAEFVWQDKTMYGIHVFAWSARHEKVHYSDFSRDWPDGIYDPNAPEDSDSDELRDTWEASAPKSEGGPYVFDMFTCIWTHTIFADCEAHCYFTNDDDWPVEQIGKENAYDWGYPGARWHPEIIQ